MYNLLAAVIQIPLVLMWHELVSTVTYLAAMNPDWGHINTLAAAISSMV